MINRLLGHPLTRGLTLDDPSLLFLRRKIIQKNNFLFHIYQDWYRLITSNLLDMPGHILELGSGAGYLNKIIPNLITSDIVYCSLVDILVDGQNLPFADNVLSAIVMTNVFHHIPNVHYFLEEAIRCLSSQGRILMIEPWYSKWSKFVYQRLHHEPFSPDEKKWDFPLRGPLSSANSALPWIVFQRDLRKFKHDFPLLRINKIQLGFPFRYLVSGGVSFRSLMPGWSTGFWRKFEKLFETKIENWAMFALISIDRK